MGGVAFGRTLRALEADTARLAHRVSWIAAGLLAIWLMWFFLGSVLMRESSSAATVEAGGAPYILQTPISGEVELSELILGHPVVEGDILLVLDASRQRLELEETQRRYDGIGAELPLLRARLDISETLASANHNVASAALQGAAAKLQAEESKSAYAGVGAERISTLHEAGMVGEMEALRASTSANSAGAERDALMSERRRLTWENRRVQAGADEERNRLLQEILVRENEQRGLAATLDRLRHEILRRTLRAPTAGLLGDVIPLRRGEYVAEGARLGAIVGAGDLVVIGQFPAQTALGRIRPGQRARVRLSAFPWTEFGSVYGVVDRVANETTSGDVRVEIGLPYASSPRIRLEHGLQASVDVEVEQISPAQFLLRAIGRR